MKYLIISIKEQKNSIFDINFVRERFLENI